MTALGTLCLLVLTLLPVAPAAAQKAGKTKTGGTTVEFELDAYAQSEDAGQATVALVRNTSSGTSVVRVTSVGGTAAAGSDYAAVDAEVTFARGQTRAIVDIPLVADDRYERDETVVLKVQSAAKNTGIGARDSSTLTVGNDDAAPQVSVAVLEPAVEGEDVHATVTLQGATDLPAQVDYTTADGTALAWQDYVPASGTLLFPVGVVERTVLVKAVEDEVHEPDELFALRLSTPVDASIATSSATAMIKDDDVAHLLSIADTTSSEGGAAQFRVTLSRANAERVYVDYATEDGTAVAPDDYAARSGTLTIDPGATEATLSVPTVGDTLPEPDEQFVVRLWNARGAAIGNGTATGTIVDASPLPVVSIAHASTAVEGGISSFRLTLSEPSSSQVTVRVTPQSGTASVGLDGSGADVIRPSDPVIATFAPNEVTADVTFPTTEDAQREDPETFGALLSHATGANVGTGTAIGTIRDNDQCVELDAAQRRQVLDRWLGGLDPDADVDGDGFTNGQELGVLAFDPDADPTRFNPLIADTPRVEVNTIGDLSVALYDKLTEGDEVGRVSIRESELVDVNRQEDIRATTEGHEVGASVEGTVGKEGDKKKMAVTVGVDYRYSRSTTEQQTTEVTRGGRELRSQEISRIRSTGKEIEGGSIAVTVRITNTGHVAFRVESAPLILRYRDDAGDLLAFGSLVPNFTFGQGPTLSPGQSKDVLYELDGIGASDTLALLEDASNLEIGLADDLELSEIGVGSINVGAGNFARYQNTIGQNTASIDIDDGRGATDRHLVSTTSFRDPHGRPLGIAMCDAVQVLFQRPMRVAHDLIEGFPVTVSGEDAGTVSSLLYAVGTKGSRSELVDENQDLNAFWITRVHEESVSGAAYGPSDVLLRSRQAAQIVYYQDEDKDKLELRDETIFGTHLVYDDDTPDGDQNPDSDDDCGTHEDPLVDACGDRGEALEAWRVVARNRAGTAMFDYPVRSDPTSPDVDDDGVPDQLERARGLDPWLADTDRDTMRDHEDMVLGPNGLAGAYFATGHTTAPGPDLTTATPMLVRTDPRIDFDWGSTSPASALPTDGFAVRWTGSLTVPESGDYYLVGVADDGFRLSLDGNKIIDRWAPDTGNPDWALVQLDAFTPYPITFESWEGTGDANVQFLYSRAWGSPNQPVPTNWLAPDPTTLDARAKGLSAEHFFDANKNQAFDDGQAFYKVHDPLGPIHTWSTGSPKASVVPFNYFMSRWSGFVTLPADAPAGDYTFGGRHDEGMRVELGGEIVYEQTTTQASATYGTPSQLTPGTQVPIVVEHWDVTGDSYVELWVNLPNGTSQKVPADWLSPLDAFSPHERAIPPDRKVWIKNQASNEIDIKLTWGNNTRVGCNVRVAIGAQHDCRIPGESFHNELSVHMAAGTRAAASGSPLQWAPDHLPPDRDECYEVTGDLVAGNTITKVNC